MAHRKNKDDKQPKSKPSSGKRKADKDTGADASDEVKELVQEADSEGVWSADTVRLVIGAAWFVCAVLVVVVLFVGPLVRTGKGEAYPSEINETRQLLQYRFFGPPITAAIAYFSIARVRGREQMRSDKIVKWQAGLIAGANLIMAGLVVVALSLYVVWADYERPMYPDPKDREVYQDPRPIDWSLPYRMRNFVEHWSWSSWLVVGLAFIARREEHAV